MGISKTWQKIAPDLRVHSGYAALVENEMTTHGETILKQIKDNNVKQVVFTGHSLGGSVAHVAHLYALATWADELVDVTFRVLSFEPTMVFFLPDPEERTDPLKAFLKDKLEKLARGFVFCGDAVPRLTGNGTFMKDVVEKLESQNQTFKAAAGFFNGREDSGANQRSSLQAI